MKTTITCNDGSEIVLTTEHSSSSYGVPVLLVDGEPFGPSDTFPSHVEGSTAGDLIPSPSRLDAGQRIAVEKFFSSDPVAAARYSECWK